MSVLAGMAKGKGGRGRVMGGAQEIGLRIVSESLFSWHRSTGENAAEEARRAWYSVGRKLLDPCLNERLFYSFI